MTKINFHKITFLQKCMWVYLKWYLRISRQIIMESIKQKVLSIGFRLKKNQSKQGCFYVYILDKSGSMKCKLAKDLEIIDCK